jgi:hypothetical protein
MADGARGERGERGRRGATGSREAGWGEVVRTLWLLAITLIGGFWIVRFEADVNDRRDQTCRLFERDHLADVERLRGTYKYLNGLAPVQFEDTLNQAILRQLPDLESEARVDSAPDYCDEDGVGLPEPDPVVPKRPAGLSVP